MENRRGNWVVTPIVLLSCFVGLIFPADKQFLLSTYLDSNPIESLSNPEPTWGLKLQEKVVLRSVYKAWDLNSTFVGQGFLEPSLILDSKLVGSAMIIARRALIKTWSFNTHLESFQKLYLKELQLSSRSMMSIALERRPDKQTKQSLGISGLRSQIDRGALYSYLEGQAFLELWRPLTSTLRSEIKLTLGQARFNDLPVRELTDSSTVFIVEGKDQKDQFGRLTIHLRHQGRMIYGLALTHEIVASNSIFGEAKTWLVKIYASQRMGKHSYLHLVLQGMDKNYQHRDLNALNLFRDPEEIIQNQIHCQLERVIDPNRSIYLQYGYLKNETIFNQWFYEKQILEVGLKLSL